MMFQSDIIRMNSKSNLARPATVGSSEWRISWCEALSSISSCPDGLSGWKPGWEQQKWQKLTLSFEVQLLRVWRSKWGFWLEVHLSDFEWPCKHTLTFYSSGAKHSGWFRQDQFGWWKHLVSQISVHRGSDHTCGHFRWHLFPFIFTLIWKMKAFVLKISRFEVSKLVLQTCWACYPKFLEFIREHVKWFLSWLVLPARWAMQPASCDVLPCSSHRINMKCVRQTEIVKCVSFVFMPW